MQICPNCGAEVHFDIASQKLACDFCGGKWEPTEVLETNTAEENSYTGNEAPQTESNETVDVTVSQSGEEASFTVVEYTCPQCGGTLYSTEESVNGFCSYCGSNHMLTSRLAKMPTPKGVIPFKITKEQCKNAYAAMIKKSLFAPKEVLNPEHLEQFRGIYIPYWMYDVKCDQTLILEGKKSYHQGEYMITEHYHCTGQLECHCDGLNYDASSSFDDHISECIAPYLVQGMEPFNPSYLSGFYADLQDVEPGIFTPFALNFAQEAAYKHIKDSHYFAGVSIDDKEKNKIKPKVEEGDISVAFYPVWFLSYRNKDRVAYAVVNGQTGRLMCDMPVDKLKFLLFSLVLAVPIFGAVYLLPTVQPSTFLLFCGMLALIITGMLTSTIKRVNRRENHADDLGYLSKYDKENFDKAAKEKSEGKKGEWTFGSVLAVILLALLLGGQVSLVLLYFLVQLLSSNISTLAVMAILIFLYIGGIKAANESKKAGSLKMGYTLILLSVLISCIVQWITPAEDIYYYISALLMLASVIVGQIYVLDQYNMLTTRPLPQLNREGGDASAPQ